MVKVSSARSPPSSRRRRQAWLSRDVRGERKSRAAMSREVKVAIVTDLDQDSRAVVVSRR
jgi:hypothetical protein